MYANSEIDAYISENWDTLRHDKDAAIAIGVIRGIAVQRVASENMNGEFVADYGYDYMHDEYGRVEVKSTGYVQPGGLRINSVMSKKDNCDHIHIIDMVNDKQFMIPHDVFFTELNLNGDMLWWSATYNQEDKIKRENTAILLEFEI